MNGELEEGGLTSPAEHHDYAVEMDFPRSGLGL